MQGGLLWGPRIRPKQEELQQVCARRSGTEAIQLTVLVSPKSTPEGPLKAPVLPGWELHEMCDVLDVLCNRSELTENGNQQQQKKGFLKFGRKNAVLKTHKNMSIFAQNQLQMHSLKVIPSDRERLPFL